MTGQSDCRGERRGGEDMTGGGILGGELIKEEKEFHYYEYRLTSS